MACSDTAHVPPAMRCDRDPDRDFSNSAQVWTLAPFVQHARGTPPDCVIYAKNECKPSTRAHDRHRPVHTDKSNTMTLPRPLPRSCLQCCGTACGARRANARRRWPTPATPCPTPTLPAPARRRWRLAPYPCPPWGGTAAVRGGRGGWSCARRTWHTTTTASAACVASCDATYCDVT